jgi:signal transduction histidine kinase
MFSAPSASRRIGWQLAFYSALVFGGLALLLGLLTAALVGRALDHQIDQRIAAEMGTLKDVYAKNGLNGLIDAISRRTDLPEGLAYRLQSSTGEVLAGALANQRALEGWSDFSLEEDDANTAETSDRFRALTETLSQLSLTVAQDTDDLEDVQSDIFNAFVLAAIFAGVLSTLGGALISRHFLQRLGIIGARAEEITKGARNLRMPLSGANDEFDNLSMSLNRVLERNAGLLERQKRISSDIAHDLRTPLTRLRQSLEAMAVRQNSHVREKLIVEVDGILSTFNALLRISEIEEGSRKAGFRFCNLSVLIEDVAAAYQAEFEDKGRALGLSIEPQLCIQGDPDLLKQLTANCLENILHHTPKGCAAKIAVAQTADSIVLSIADNGPGISVENRKWAFETGQRLGPNASLAGHGFGLKLIKAVADLHTANIALLEANPGLIVRIEFAQPATTAV